MAETSRELAEFLSRSLREAVASIAIGDDGLDKIRTRIAQTRSLAAADDRHAAARGTSSTRANRPSIGRGRGVRLSTRPIRHVRGLDPQVGG